MSSARTPLPTLNERDTEQVRSPKGSPNSLAGPLHLAEPPPSSAPLVPLLPSCKPRLPCHLAPGPVHLPSESSPGTHLVQTPSCTLVFLPTPPPSPLTTLLRSSVLPPQLPLLFPFSLGGLSGLPPPTLKAATLLFLDWHPAICPRSLSTSSSIPPASLPLRPHRFSQSQLSPSGSLPRSVFSMPIPFQFPGFLPCLLHFPDCALPLACNPPAPPSSPFQIFRLLFAHHFPFSSPGAPWCLALAFVASVFSRTAVMRIVFPQVVFGVPVFTPFRVFGSLTFSSSGGCVFESWPPVSHCECCTSLLPGLFLPRERQSLFQPHFIYTTCCSVLSPALPHPRPCLSVLLHRNTNREAFLFLHSWICHFR